MAQKKLAAKIADALKPKPAPEGKAPKPAPEGKAPKPKPEGKAAKSKTPMKRVRVLTPMAGPLFSAAPGDVLPFPLDEAEGLIKSGAAEDVDTDEAKLRKLAKDAGYDLVEAG